jgi:hypothetical protein
MTLGRDGSEATRGCCRPILLKNSERRRVACAEVSEEPMRRAASGARASWFIGLQTGAAFTFRVIGVSHFAIRRRFCTVAAIRNSSLAPLRPRKRSRSSFRMRLR